MPLGRPIAWIYRSRDTPSASSRSRSALFAAPDACAPAARRVSTAARRAGLTAAYDSCRTDGSIKAATASERARLRVWRQYCSMEGAYQLDLVEHAVQARLAESLHLGLDEEHVGADVHESGLVVHPHLLAGEELLPSALVLLTVKLTMIHWLMRCSAFSYARALVPSPRPMRTESTYAVRKVIISNTYVLGSGSCCGAARGIQLYSASSKNDSSLDAITASIRLCAMPSVSVNDSVEAILTGPPRCVALTVS